ncbi:MAG: UDP-3-O-acyl-N-acetylglucosamine deacetylase [Leptospiraceae bacterium]|jgi:UDP-3-O-[3-hydroxymyristoyl] N-acetylglucosamine deacetylase|nr:UDP-3-O-acyl-N-acetylglucosamine deacetylase [Leptospiraceae bacterium]MBK7056846.1 UDP-3-O-acyl-N-acetylglucosamine deacetylase [Leptospiraceae bacterium]MBK9501237.1 UDP-3-O-acyl-N-acetylglucosamine deacetylase [Leptospiraceae bacterium]MBP9162524.1 UDP-3-O-acyl-N-acetylglucosamine deacetylase [Leptospiraceae bacterium]HRG47068.1 UDP-3-O-acyl-N-acetylglucosamine deacetylase [Leptospiraceae bacterium]
MDSKIFRKTLKSQITISGIGLHSGKKVSLKLIPAEAHTGLIFICNVRNKKSIIPVSLNYVVDTSNAVTLGDGFRIVQTVEHLMAALFTRGITDLIMEIDSSEIPIMDGSSRPFLEAIDSIGVTEFTDVVDPIRITTPVWVVDGDKYIVILPSETLKVTYNIHFNHPLLRGQSITMDLDEKILSSEILPARTFGFLRDVEALQARGLALGGSLDNAIVLSEDGYLNESLRFENECIRHKVLDLIGDLSIVGRPIIGHILASKAGHALDVSMGKLIMSRITGDEVSKFKSKRIHDFRNNKVSAFAQEA